MTSQFFLNKILFPWVYSKIVISHHPLFPPFYMQWGLIKQIPAKGALKECYLQDLFLSHDFHKISLGAA